MSWLRRLRSAPEPRVRPPWLVPSTAHASTSKVVAERVRHTYDNHVVALRDVSLNVRSGEFVCLVGPSGCGKSTLLAMFAGHVFPTSGVVSIDHRTIRGPGPDRFLMFQEAGLYPWMSLEGNLRFALGARGVPRSERRALAHRFIEQVHLSGFERALPHQLSGGMKMRASLARALAMNSPVLLMDEPFGSLDAHTRTQMQRLVQRMWLDSPRTIVFVTHDVREALTLGTRVVVMAPHPGRILRDLELRLPMPRDPDDQVLAQLAQQVRGLLEHPERRDLEDGLPQEVGDEPVPQMAPERRLPRRLARSLGAAGPLATQSADADSSAGR